MVQHSEAVTRKQRFIPANPSAYTDVVGDGKFIKLDRAAPGNDLFESGTVTMVMPKERSGSEKSRRRDSAFINRYIRTEVEIESCL